VGLEAAESLREKGLEVTVVQRSNHVLSTLDREMAVPLAKNLSLAAFALSLKGWLRSL
jgi:pyruvate/2-oxoglutarate dehydrogenase complex dihydrolipoamide dehydrogenase (E3) component